MKTYIFKAYNDGYAYGEEAIRVFANRNDAEAALKADVENTYGIKWDEIPEKIGLSEADTFEKDYVSIGGKNGDTSFWIVEEKEVEETATTRIMEITAIEPERAFTMQIELLDNSIPMNIDAVRQAVTDACKEYARTENGRNTLDYNCGSFNWADFEANVPKDICEKHGFRVLDSTGICEEVNWDEQLIDGSEDEEYLDSIESRDFLEISTTKNGEKFVKISGYIYYCEDDMSTTPYRYVDYSDDGRTVKELKDELKKAVEGNILTANEIIDKVVEDDKKLYIEDLSEKDAAGYFRDSLGEISLFDINEDTPDGVYMVKTENIRGINPGLPTLTINDAGAVAFVRVFKPDGSFEDYKTLDNTFVYPGQKIQVFHKKFWTWNGGKSKYFQFTVPSTAANGSILVILDYCGYSCHKPHFDASAGWVQDVTISTESEISLKGLIDKAGDDLRKTTGISIVDFSCDDLSGYVSPLLFKSGTEIARAIFEYKDEKLEISLRTVGDISITYKGETYYSPDEYPEELIEKIKNDPDNWYYCAPSGEGNDEEENYVTLNNWFEYVYDGDGDEYDGYLYKDTPESVLADMVYIAKRAFGFDKKA